MEFEIPQIATAFARAYMPKEMRRLLAPVPDRRGLSRSLRNPNWFTRFADQKLYMLASNGRVATCYTVRNVDEFQAQEVLEAVCNHKTLSVDVIVCALNAAVPSTLY